MENNPEPHPYIHSKQFHTPCLTATMYIIMTRSFFSLPTDQQALPSPSLHSESSASEQSSDEEYMCPLTKKKPKPKKTVQKVKEEKREPAARSEEEEIATGGETGKTGYKLVSAASYPPQLVRTSHGQSAVRDTSSDFARKQVSKLVRPEAPPLVKTAWPSSSHRHYSSGEIKVVPGNAVGVVMGGASSKQGERQLLPKVKQKLDHMSPIISLPKIHQPQVILSAGVQRPPPPLVSTKSRDSQGHSHSIISATASHSLSSSQHHRHHTQTQKSSKRVSIDPSLLGPSKKPSPHKSPKTVPPFSLSSPVKKSKPPPNTQYGVIAASPSSAPHKIQTPTTSFSMVQLPSNIPRVMTPIQLVSPNQNQAPHALTATSQGAYQTAMGSGGLIFLQGGTPQTTYISQGGQTYQVINPGAAVSAESSQKVSVIMQPPVGTTYLTSADLQGGIQYIRQLDGPPDREKSPGGSGQGDKTRDEFEKMRQSEREKLGLGEGDKNSTSWTPAVRDPRREKFLAPQHEGVTETHGGRGESIQRQSPEDRMSEKLKFYLAKEKERVKGAPSKSPLATKTGETGSANRGSSPQTSSLESAPGDRIPYASLRQRGRRSSLSESSSRSRKKLPSVSQQQGSKLSRLVVSPTLFRSSSSPPDPSGQIPPEPLSPTKTTTGTTKTTTMPKTAATTNTPRTIKKAIGGAKTKAKLQPKPLFSPDNLTEDDPVSSLVSSSASPSLIGQSALQTTPTSFDPESESVGLEQGQGEEVQCLNSNSNNNGKSGTSDQEPNDVACESHSETAAGNVDGMELGQTTRNVGMESGQGTHHECGMEQDSLLGKRSTEEDVVTPPRKRGRPAGRGRGRGRGKGKTQSGSPRVEENRPIRSCPDQQHSPEEGSSQAQDESGKEPTPPRKRGRPKKSTNQTTSSGQGSIVESETKDQDTPETPSTPRTRGMRRREADPVQDTPTTSSQQSETETETEVATTPRRQRGRPRGTPGSGKSRSFPCNHCGEAFTTKYLLQVHTDNEHPPDLGVCNHYITMTSSVLHHNYVIPSTA